MSNGLDWKPDFTQDNPWEDMPGDYEGIATFVPIEDNPTPPWEGEEGAEDIPEYGTTEYAERAQGIAATTPDPLVKKVYYSEAKPAMEAKMMGMTKKKPSPIVRPSAGVEAGISWAGAGILLVLLVLIAGRR